MQISPYPPIEPAEDGESQLPAPYPSAAYATPQSLDAALNSPPQEVIESGQVFEDADQAPESVVGSINNAIDESVDMDVDEEAHNAPSVPTDVAAAHASPLHPAPSENPPASSLLFTTPNTPGVPRSAPSAPSPGSAHQPVAGSSQLRQIRVTRIPAIEEAADSAELQANNEEYQDAIAAGEAPRQGMQVSHPYTDRQALGRTWAAEGVLDLKHGA